MVSRRFRTPLRARVRPLNGLWTNQDFLYLWKAETVSQFGSHITPVAIPLLAALTLDASPFEMGLLATASGLPTLVFGLIAGAWVDRLPRKPLMIGADLVRAAVLLAIPIAAVFDLLSIPLLIVVALVGGLMTVIFNASYSSLLPLLVRRQELSDANGKLYSSMSVAQVAGPALAGSLVGLLTAPFVLLVDSLSFLWSAWFLHRIRHTEGGPSIARTRTHLWREVLEGWRALVGSPVLRATSASSATINLAGYMFLSVYVLYMTDDLGLSSTGVGLVFAAGGVGSLAGSVTTAALCRRYGVGPTLAWSALGFGVFGLTVPAAILVPNYALPLVVFAECLQWMTLIVFNVTRLSLRQSLTPDHLQGRVSATNQVLVGGMAPLGSFLGGVIGQVWSVHAALVIGCIGMFLAAAWVWFSPTVHIREMPAGPDEALA